MFRYLVLPTFCAVFVFVKLVKAETEFTASSDDTTMTEMMQYLSSFGYVESSQDSVGHLQTADELSTAIRILQRVANLPETGVLDGATARYIATPRCGVSDRNLVDSLRTRKKRYAISKLGKWTKKKLTWKLKRSTHKMHETEVLHELHAAFKLWSDGSGLEFFQVSSDAKADIELDFFSRRHYDSNSFDGQGGVLAHAFYPRTVFAGHLHFDDDENWKTHEQAKQSLGSSTSFFYVAAHELGHSLGLEHSAEPNSLMMPSYPGPMDVFVLPDDDLLAIRYLYGSKNNNGDGRPYTSFPLPDLRPTKRPLVTRPVPVTPRPRPDYDRTTQSVYERPTVPPTPSVELCPMTFDTIASIRGELFIFKGKNMWRITRHNDVYGPTLTHAFWKGLPEDLERIDAVYERQTQGSNIVFFIGQRYWLFDGNVMLRGYPQYLTSLGLPYDVQRIDASLVWGHNGKTYFFSGDKYWKFNESRNRIDADYPRDITVWRGIPSNLSAALRWEHGTTYFFKDRVFWKFDNAKMEVDNDAGRLSHPYWIDCLGKAYDVVEMRRNRYDVDHDRSASYSSGTSVKNSGASTTSVSCLFNCHQAYVGFITVFVLLCRLFFARFFL